MHRLHDAFEAIKPYATEAANAAVWAAALATLALRACVGLDIHRWW